MKAMKFHHLGIACNNLNEMLSFIRKTHDLLSESDVVFDPKQNASLCLFRTREGMMIELVCGEVVKNLAGHGTTYYHCCYEVENMEETLMELCQEKCKVVSGPTPAQLFENRRVCFLMTPMGLIELLEE